MKRMLVFCLVLMMVLMTACESNTNAQRGSQAETVNNETEGERTPNVIVDVSRSGSDAETRTPNVIIDVSGGPNRNTETEKVVDEDDPCRMLIVDEAYAREHGGGYIRRGNKYYVINLPEREMTRAYEFGRGNKDGGPLARLYEWENWDTILSMGKVPILTFLPGDELVSFSGKNMDIYPAEFVGYSVRIIWHKTDDGLRSGKFVYESLDTERTRLPGAIIWDTLEVRDSNDNLIERENWRKIPYREVCTVGWYVGVQYHEVTMEADCSFYRLSMRYDEGAYFLEGTLHRESYASFDLSEVTPGLYGISCGGDIPVIVRIE